MKWKLLQLKNAVWEFSEWGETAIVMRIKDPAFDTLSTIHRTASALEKMDKLAIVDLVVGLDSITFTYDSSKLSSAKIIQKIKELAISTLTEGNKPTVHRIPVCYEKGLDWEELQKTLDLPIEEIIAAHSGARYTVAMMGFLPGFVYLSGLPELLQCSRKKVPRTKVVAGSVGIGGAQTGIYSFPSPGGWQIIGQTPLHFFDAYKIPPTTIQAGDNIQFHPISLSTFENYKKKSAVTR